MKVEKFRIKNYKSIEDSGNCYLDGKITILAGKNEAGKTAILEALEDFSVDKEIRKDAISIKNKDSIPEIIITLKLEKEETDKMLEEFDLQNVNELPELGILKAYPKRYEICEDFLKAINSPVRAEFERIENDLENLISEIRNYTSNFPVSNDLIDNPQQILAILGSYSQQVIVQHNPNLAQDQLSKIVENVQKIKELATDLNSYYGHETEIIEYIEQNFIPNFILFKTFDDILPSQKSISESSNTPIIKDLGFISGLDFNVIQPATDPREREKHKERVNLNFSEEYKEFWTQDHSNLYISWDSNNIYFWIKEGNEFYNPEIRSKGRQWHLSFYIRVTARSFDGKDNVILIDEPGLFLHAKAQKDILEKLDECSERTQIIYSTHSPYLIPTNTLNRVRLVIKDDDIGTKIEKLTAKADKETLTPILTAIGEDLSGGLKVDKKHSIVLEGYSDYLWLISFKKLLSIKDELNFVPSVGAGSIPHVGSILFGWGLDPIFILDNDSSGKATKQKLTKSLSIDENRIVDVPFDKKGCIEDLFSEEDRNKYTNYRKTDKKSKVLQATEFHQGVETGAIKPSNLSDETRVNFEKVFIKLRNVLNDTTK